MLTVIIYKDGFVKDVVKVETIFTEEEKARDNRIQKYIDKNYKKSTWKILDEKEDIKNILGW